MTQTLQRCRMSPNTSLADYLQTVYRPDRVNLRGPTVRQIQTSINRFAAFLGRPPSLRDLNEETITAFKTAFSSGGLSRGGRTPAPATINSKVKDLASIWRLAWERRHVDAAPRKIRRAREPRRQPKAYTVDEMRRIVEAAMVLPGTVGLVNRDPYVIERRLWWTALILTCYSTAARIGAVLAVRTEDYDGRLYLRAETQKQHADQSVSPSPEAVDAIEAIYDPHRPTLFWWPYGRRYLYKYHKDRILTPAGIRSTRSGMDQFQKYRRTGISLVAAENEDLAVKLAGHSSPAITRRNYIDPDVVTPHAAAALLPCLHAGHLSPAILAFRTVHGSDAAG